MDRLTVRFYLALFALFLLIPGVWLSNALCLWLLSGAGTLREISDANPTPVTPAVWIFSVIWGFIYALMALLWIHLALSLWGPRKFHGTASEPTDDFWLLFFCLSCAFNIVWIYMFQYGFLRASFFIIWGLWWMLLIIYVRMHLVNPLRPEDRHGLGEYLAIYVFTSVYLAWISVAVVVNLLAWTQWKSETTAVVFLVAIVVLVIVFAVLFRDYWYAGTSAVALFAITTKQVQTAPGTAALVLAIVCLVCTMLPLLQKVTKRIATALGGYGTLTRS